MKSSPNYCAGCIHADGCGYFDPDLNDPTWDEERMFEEHCVGCACGDGCECNKGCGCDNYEEEDTSSIQMHYKMTVGELIDRLQQFPKEMRVVDYMYDDIINIKATTWTDSNYPFNRPDEQVCMIE